MSRSIVTGILSLLFAFAVPPEARADSYRYFDYPEGENIILSSSPGTNAMDALNPDLKIRVDRNAKFIPKAGSNGWLKGDVEWVDSQGNRRVARNVWVDSNDTRDNPLMRPPIRVTITKSQTSSEPPCPLNTVNPALSKLATSFKALPNSEADVSTALAFFGSGRCIPLPADYKKAQQEFEKTKQLPPEKSPGLFRETLGRGFEDAKTPGVVARYKGVALGMNHLFAIESMARTIYGEMRGCTKYGARYPMAVARVIMNRAADVSKKGVSENFIAPRSEGFKSNSVGDDKRFFKNADELMIVPHLFEAPRQFSTWNRGDANNDEALCPKTDSPEWKTAVNTAVLAVMKDPDFMKKTDSLNGVKYYTSGIVPSWGAQELEGKSVDGQPVDKKSCLRFWKTNKDE